MKKITNILIAAAMLITSAFSLNAAPSSYGSSEGSKSSFGSSGSSGGSKSSSWGSSTSKPSAPAASSWGSSASKPSAPAAPSNWGSSASKPSAPAAPSTSKSIFWGSSNSTKTSTVNDVKKGSSTDSALAAKTSMTPETVKKRSDVVESFKRDNAQTYSNKFANEPASRPTYIPQNYNDGGTTRNIYYNYNSGGYGYMNALGTFILYDALTHAAYSHADRVVYVDNNETSSNVGAVLLWTLLIIGLVIGTIIFIFRKEIF